MVHTIHTDDEPGQKISNLQFIMIISEQEKIFNTETDFQTRRYMKFTQNYSPTVNIIFWKKNLSNITKINHGIIFYWLDKKLTIKWKFQTHHGFSAQ